MINYGKLFGQVKLYYDPHHDEVYIGDNGVIVMRNKRWCYTTYELMALFYEITGYVPRDYNKHVPKNLKHDDDNLFKLMEWGY